MGESVRASAGLVGFQAVRVFQAAFQNLLSRRTDANESCSDNMRKKVRLHREIVKFHPEYNEKNKQKI